MITGQQNNRWLALKLKDSGGFNFQKFSNRAVSKHINPEMINPDMIGSLRVHAVIMHKGCKAWVSVMTVWIPWSSMSGVIYALYNTSEPWICKWHLAYII